MSTISPHPEPYYSDPNVTLYLGDCREVLPTLGQFDACITDPPYGDTSLEWDTWPTDWLDSVAQRTSSLWCFGSMRMFLDQSTQFSQWRYAQEVVWRKNSGTGFQNDRFKRVHEFAVQWYRGEWRDVYKLPPRIETGARLKGRTIKRGPTAHYGKHGEVGWVDEGTRLMHSVIEMRNMHGRAIHPTEKPTGILEPLLSYSVPEHGAVLDPFAGSGSLLAAAKGMGLRAVGVEANEEYCERAANRLAQESLFGGVA